MFSPSKEADVSATSHGNGWLARLAGWWRGGRSTLDELDRCGENSEHLAHDLCISATELRTIAAKRPDSAALLKPRLAALGIDRERLVNAVPEVLRDLERVCTLCGSKRQCERDLATNPSDPRWRAYCPNVSTLDALHDTSTDNVTPPKSKL